MVPASCRVTAASPGVQLAASSAADLHSPPGALQSAMHASLSAATQVSLWLRTREAACSH